MSKYFIWIESLSWIFQILVLPILRGNSQAIGASSPPSVNGSQTQSSIEPLLNKTYAIFHGDGTGLIMPQSETTDRMQAVIDRLDEASGRYLVSSDLLQNEEFLTYAEDLSDTDLKNFAHTVKGLRTPPDQLSENAFFVNGIASIKGLFEDLQAMSGETVSRVLEKTAELSAPVPAYNTILTYDAGGKLPLGSAAANPSHNFVEAISTIESASIDEQANSLLDNLELYGEDL